MLTIITAAALLTPAATDDELLARADERIAQVRMGDATLRVYQGEKPVPEGTELTIEQTRHAFLFGANIFGLGQFKTPEDNAAFEKRFSDLLNFATLPFYWWNYEPRQGQPSDERTERIVKWCSEHRITCKGHPLAWNWVDPPWLPDDPAKVMELQISRIEKCTRQWDGRIDCWDVVNEATEYDRDGPKKNAPKLTAGIHALGVPGYVRQAFAAARRGNPEARLIINDYITTPAFATRVIDQLVDEQGKPMYDIIGIQCHQHGGAWSASHIWEICERFAKYGKPLHFTEATILSGKVGWGLRDRDPKFDWKSTPEGEARQASEVVRFYKMLFSHPAVEAITWWDTCDQRAWQGAPAGWLRRDMTPKPAYDELKKLIKGAWWTKATSRVETGGRATFRGFYGQYEVRTKSGGRELKGEFALVNGQTAPIEVRLRPLE